MTCLPELVTMKKAEKLEETSNTVEKRYRMSNRYAQHVDSFIRKTDLPCLDWEVSKEKSRLKDERISWE